MYPSEVRIFGKQCLPGDAYFLRECVIKRDRITSGSLYYLHNDVCGQLGWLWPVEQNQKDIVVFRGSDYA